MDTTKVTRHLEIAAEYYTEYFECFSNYMAEYPTSIQTALGIVNLQHTATKLANIEYRYHSCVRHLFNTLDNSLRVRVDPGNYIIIGIPGLAAIWYPLPMELCHIEHYPEGLQGPEEFYWFNLGGLPDNTTIYTGGHQYYILAGKLVILPMSIQ